MKMCRVQRWAEYSVITVWLLFLFALGQARAEPPDNRPPDNRPPDHGQEVSQTQNQEAAAESYSSSESTAESISGASAEATGGTAYGGTATATGGAGGEGGSAYATTEGNTVTVENSTNIENSSNYRSESNNTNIVLVPNNNTSNCMRVYGISFGSHEGAAGLGIPTRDLACDFEQAADDAAATGDHDLAWFWRCHKKGLYKQFDGGNKQDRIAACHQRMLQLRLPPIPNAYAEPVLRDEVVIPKAEYDQLLMAQVQQEELDEAIEQAESRYMEQKTMIEELQTEVQGHKNNEAELARLKRESAALRKAQEEEEAQQQSIRAKFAARLAEREQEQEDTESDQ